MSLERAIRNRWATDDQLPPLVPLARVYTGAAYGNPEFPYVVVARHDSQPQTRTSSGAVIAHTRVLLTVWSVTLDEGQQIARAIQRRFDRAHFDLDPSDAGSVLAMQLDRTQEQLHDDATWQVTCEYVVMTEHKA